MQATTTSLSDGAIRALSLAQFVQAAPLSNVLYKTPTSTGTPL